jgi:hypothetical protein
LQLHFGILLMFYGFTSFYFSILLDKKYMYF